MAHAVFRGPMVFAGSYVIKAAGPLTLSGKEVQVVINLTTPAAFTLDLMPSAQLLPGTMLYIKDGAGNAATYNITINTNVMMPNGTTLVQAALGKFKVNGNLTAQSGSVFTHWGNGGSRIYDMGIKVTGNFDLQSGSSISLTSDVNRFASESTIRP